VQTGRVEGSADRARGRQCREGVWKALQMWKADNAERGSEMQIRQTVQQGNADRAGIQGVQQDSEDRAGRQAA
jgi:hypothetical protein